jgi:hypothetical protein
MRPNRAGFGVGLSWEGVQVQDFQSEYLEALGAAKRQANER